jgi:hypothetical protein
MEDDSSAVGHGYQRDPFQDIDPDRNLLNSFNTMKSEYLDIDQFKAMTVSENVTAHDLSFLHANVRSLRKNFDAFELTLGSLDFPFPIIGMSETWHTDATVGAYELHGYASVHRMRKERRGGGVSLFISQRLCFKERTDLTLATDNVDSLFVEINHAKKPIVVGLIYRPPDGDRQQFIHDLSIALHSMRAEKKSCILMGDFNTDMMANDDQGASNALLDTMYSHAFFPLITKPTRVDDNRGSATLLDNIFSNDIRNKPNVIPGILITDISDHYMVMAMCKGSSGARDETRNFKTRNMEPERMAIFKDIIANTDWTEATQHSDAQDAYSTFLQLLTSAYNEAFPMVTKKIRDRRNQPWLTAGLKASIRRKNKMFCQYKKSPTLYARAQYNDYKAQLTRTLREAEIAYNSDLLEQNKRDLRKSWSIMKQILGTSARTTCTSEFRVDGELTDDKKRIADGFNHCFVNLGPNLASGIKPKTNQSPESFLGVENRSTQSIFVNPVTIDEVITAMKTLKSGSGAGWDDVKPSALKEVADLIVVPLTDLINLSLQQGVVPVELKIARVVPIYKAGEKQELVNYRPVSVLPSVSKVYERVVYNRVISFLERSNSLSPLQFGFRKNHSTSLALTYFIDKATQALDNRDNFIGIYVDLSKAFDTVDHRIIAAKLDHYGIRGMMKDWLIDYLRGRSQFVSYNNQASDHLPVTCGVPQGSILGPLLFLIYLNDLPQVCSRLSSVMFADDTTFFYQHSDLDTAVNVVNEDLCVFAEWLRVNKLSLNVQKTKCMYFTINPRARERELPVNIEGAPVATVKETKFLGVIVQNNLRWTAHVNYISRKIAKGIGVLSKVRHKLPQKSLISLYFTLVYPYLHYCNSIWAADSATSTTVLHRLQKRVVRVIHKLHPRESTGAYFRLAGIMTISEINRIETAIFAYKWKFSLLPTLFDRFFSLRSDTHSRQTRSAQTFNLIKCRTETRKRSLAFRAAALLNRIYELNVITFSTIMSVKLFKRTMRNAVIDGMF